MAVMTANQKKAKNGNSRNVLQHVHDDVQDRAQPLVPGLLVPRQVQRKHVPCGHESVEGEDEDGVHGHAADVDGDGPQQVQGVVEVQIGGYDVIDVHKRDLSQLNVSAFGVFPNKRWAEPAATRPT